MLTHTVAETAALLDVMAGYEPGDASWAPPPRSRSPGRRARAGRLRIGVTTAAPIDAPLDPLCERAVRDTAELLESLGHQVDEVEAPWTGQSLLEVFTLVFGTPIAMGFFFGAQVSGREPTEELVEPLSWTIWNGIREHTALDYLLARTQLGVFTRADRGALERLDVVLMPALRPAPGADRRDRRLQRRALGGLPPLGRVHPVHGGSST